MLDIFEHSKKVRKTLSDDKQLKATLWDISAHKLSYVENAFKNKRNHHEHATTSFVRFTQQQAHNKFLCFYLIVFALEDFIWILLRILFLEKIEQFSVENIGIWSFDEITNSFLQSCNVRP